MKFLKHLLKTFVICGAVVGGIGGFFWVFINYMEITLIVTAIVVVLFLALASYEK